MVTRKDVAKLAGVSVTIVSRVMNNNGYVAAEKREAVKRAAEQLGYRNSVSLPAEKKTHSLLFYSKDLGNQFNIELYRGLLSGAAHRGYTVALSGNLLTNITAIHPDIADGLIFANDDLAHRYHDTIMPQVQIPAVAACFGSTYKNPNGIPFVDADYMRGVELLIQHLRVLGHTKIGLASPYVFFGDQPRHIGYVLAMQPVLGQELTRYAFCNRYEFSDAGNILSEEFYRLEGIRAADEFVERKSDATAIICFNDDFAIGMIRRLYELGIRVPEDLSVAAFDGTEFGQTYIPRLTTIQSNPARIGEELARILLDMIDGIRVRNRTELPINLIVGESTAPPKSLP